jgi:hypothetical protein
MVGSYRDFRACGYGPVMDGKMLTLSNKSLSAEIKKKNSSEAITLPKSKPGFEKKLLLAMAGGWSSLPSIF